MKKCNILKSIQEKTIFSYDIIKNIFEITGSYDAILDLNEIALKYNKDIIECAYFLYGKKDLELTGKR